MQSVASISVRGSPNAISDSATGYFISAFKDFGRDTSESFWVRYVHRWRLEKKEPTAAVSEVVKPIVYYIDRTVPIEYRPFVKQGVEELSDFL